MSLFRSPFTLRRRSLNRRVPGRSAISVNTPQLLVTCFRIFRDGQRGSNTSPRSMRSARRSDVRFNMILTLMCVLTSRKLGDYLDLRNHRRRISCTQSLEQPVSSARSEEHTSELQSLMRISYDVFCLKKKTH